MTIDHRDLISYLSSLQGFNCQLLRFPGNYGDSLIWHGTQVLLARAGVQYETIENHNPPTSEVLLIDGGGNLNDSYHDVERYLTKYGTGIGHVVILPHSITGVRAFSCLSRHCPSATIFCRERATFESVRMTLPFADVRLAHDCSFAVDVTCWIDAPVTNCGPLFAFRQDAESLYFDLPRSNRDISREGYAMASLSSLMEAISSYEQIHTDRLHLAIAGALLNREVFLYPNSYFKNRAVFEHSLSHYAGVNFVATSTRSLGDHLRSQRNEKPT